MCSDKVVGGVLPGRRPPGTLSAVHDEAGAEELVDEGTRPCDFCRHPVVIDSLDEWDCPVCAVPDEDQPESAGRDS